MQTLFDLERGDVETNGNGTTKTAKRIPRLRCADWLSTNWKMLSAERLPVKTICERLATATQCQCDISEEMLKSLVKGMGKDGTEIGLRPKRRRSKDSPQLGKGNAVRHLAAQLVLTQQLLSSLCEQLGHTNPLLTKIRPDWLRKFANGKTSLKTAPAIETTSTP